MLRVHLGSFAGAVGLAVVAAASVAACVSATAPEASVTEFSTGGTAAGGDAGSSTGGAEVGATGGADATGGAVATGGADATGGDGGATGGDGGSTAGNGGSTAGNGGTAAGAGGTTAGNGGTTAGNGGTTAGAGGSTAGNGGTVGTGGDDGCSDLAQNNDETDVDCGGGTCPACAVGDSCLTGSDCESGVCGSGSENGGISWERWDNVGGSDVILIPLAAQPDATGTFLALEMAPPNIGDDYGLRIRGYLIPPDDGEYTFWIASDNESELWLSTDDTEGNRALLAYHTGYTGVNNWDKYPEQQSAPVTLVADQRYYIEVLFKEDGGDDHVSVGWAKPGEGTTAPSEVIPPSALATYGGADDVCLAAD